MGVADMDVAGMDCADTDVAGMDACAAMGTLRPVSGTPLDTAALFAETTADDRDMDVAGMDVAGMDVAGMDVAGMDGTVCSAFIAVLEDATG